MRIVALIPDLFFASKVQETLRAAGHNVEVVGSQGDALEAAPRADAVVVDLHAQGLEFDALVAGLGETPALGFYSHVDADRRAAAERAGFALVVPRSRMAREMPVLVAGLVPTRP